ncbi:YtcA family lipoprotein [Cupriavidus necator]|uniref:YtcA family lipoprotein n=1 Tax=Cupriavidus necator TaxID=106590 RepID=UPI0005B30477|nr:YtcA family lipoprotein [Cupriavidus necator]
MARSLALVASAALLHGCAGAPSFSLFGAYFPLWLLSALVGIAGAIVSHRILIKTGWAETVRYQLLVNTAIGVMIAEIVWLLGTGHIL